MGTNRKFTADSGVNNTIIKNPVGEKRKMKIVFFGLSDLRVGKGVERSLLNYVKWFPKDVWDVTLIETDFFPSSRFSHEYISGYMEGVELLKHKSDLGFISAFNFKNDTIKLIFNFVFSYFIRILIRIKESKNILRVVQSADVVYLSRNQDSSYCSPKKNKLIVGTNHVFFGKIFDPNIDVFTRIIYKFIKIGIYFHKINCFHFFRERGNPDKIVGDKQFMIIHSGVDTNNFFPKFDRPTENSIQFLFVGSLDTGKGIDRLLEAWSKVSNKGDSVLNIVGTGELQPLVIDTVKKDSHVNFHGVLSDVDLAEVYRKCDIFVYPSKSDTFGLVVIEALASGNYVICSDFLTGIFDDFVAQNSIEYVTPNVEKFKLAIENSIARISAIQSNDRILKQYQYIKEKYDWKSISLELSSKLTECLLHYEKDFPSKGKK